MPKEPKSQTRFTEKEILAQVTSAAIAARGSPALETLSDIRHKKLMLFAAELLTPLREMMIEEALTPQELVLVLLADAVAVQTHDVLATGVKGPLV